LGAGATALSACNRGGTRAVRIAIFRGEEFTPLAKALGHFGADGIDVEVHELQSSSKAMEALFGGSTDVVAGGYDHAVRLAIEGRRSKSFTVLTVRSPLALVASPRAGHIGRVADLKGATVGVSAFGSSGNHFLNFLLARNGLKRDDVQLIATGGGHAVTVASAEQGRADAIVTLPASLAILRARNPGLRVLADATSVEGTRAIFGVDYYPGICMMAGDRWLEANEDAASKLARAMVRTLVWVRQHTAEEMLGKLGRPGLREEADGLRSLIAAASADGVMPPKGPEAVREMLAATYPAVRELALENTFTNRFVS
jgi:NitT/TauT family transport system substrate-binding protein